MSDPLNHLGSIWYHSEPSDVPYFPNQFLALDVFCHFLQQDSFSNMSLLQTSSNGHFINTSTFVQRVSSSNMSHTKMCIFLLEPHVFISFLQHRRPQEKLVIAMIFNALCSVLLMSHKINIRPCFA